MKNFLLILIVLLMPLALASPDLEVRKIDGGSVVVSELDNPAVFDFEIQNKGAQDQFEIYTLIGVSMWPKGKFDLPFEKKTMEVRAFPNEIIRKDLGFFQFEYQIRGKDTGIFRDTLLIKVVALEDTIEIEPRPLDPDDEEVTVVIKNLENTHIESLAIEFNSLFFISTEEISLAPFEEISIPIQINKEDLEGVSAGSYIVTAEMGEVTIEGIVDYLEKEGTSLETTSEGFFIRKTTITKTNKGNTQTTAMIEIKKGIISRLFTTNSPKAKTIERNGLFVDYVWEKPLNPAETLIVETTTNYIFPFVLLVIIILIGIAVKIYSTKALSLGKKVSFVRTKKGEFALKVSLHVKARRHVKNVQIIDMLPLMTKLFENFGKKPDRVDPKTKRMFWSIDSLTRGEKRVYSYVIYSKLNIIGRFELSPALAIYEYNNKVKEILSNKAYFVREKGY